MVMRWWHVGGWVGVAVALVGCHTGRNLFRVPAEWDGVALGRPNQVQHAPSRPGQLPARFATSHQGIDGRFETLRETGSGDAFDPARWKFPSADSIVSIDFVEPEAWEPLGLTNDAPTVTRLNPSGSFAGIPSAYVPRHVGAERAEIDRGTYRPAGSPVPQLATEPTERDLSASRSTRRSVWDQPVSGPTSVAPTGHFEPADNGTSAAPSAPAFPQHNPPISVVPIAPTPVDVAPSGVSPAVRPAASQLPVRSHGDRLRGAVGGAMSEPSDGRVSPSVSTVAEPAAPHRLTAFVESDRGDGSSNRTRSAAPRAAAPVDTVVAASPFSSATPIVRANDDDSANSVELSNDGAALDVESLVSRALAAHPAVAQAEADLAAARGLWNQAGLGPNPLVGFSGQQLASNGQAEQIGLLFQQEFLRGNKLGLGQAVAAQEVARAEERIQRARLSVEGSVRRAHAAAAMAQRRRDLAERLSAIAQENERIVNVLVESREASQVELLRARTQTRLLAAEFEAASSRLDGAIAALEAAIGQPLNLDGTRPIVLDDYPNGSIEPLDPSIVDRIDAHPDLIDATIAIEQARWQLQRECAERVSDVDVQMIVQYDEATDSPNGALQITAPWMIRNRNQGNIRAARAGIVSASRAAERKRLELDQQFAAKIADYEAARARVERYAETDGILDSSRRASAMLQQSVQAGEEDLLAFFLAEKERMAAEQQYLDLLESALDARADLETLMISSAR